MKDTELETETGEIRNIITTDYLIELYEEIQATEDLTTKQRDERVAVLQVLKDHIGEYMVVKYKENNKINE